MSLYPSTCCISWRQTVEIVIDNRIFFPVYKIEVNYWVVDLNFTCVTYCCVTNETKNPSPSVVLENVDVTKIFYPFLDKVIHLTPYTFKILFNLCYYGRTEWWGHSVTAQLYFTLTPLRCFRYGIFGDVLLLFICPRNNITYNQISSMWSKFQDSSTLKHIAWHTISFKI